MGIYVRIFLGRQYNVQAVWELTYLNEFEGWSV